MCVIAGYVGDRPAAEVLVEMLRRQQNFDGALSTGIATIHEGKLYCKRTLGDLDEFLSQVDLSELPGTIGIAHSRPDNNHAEYVHPYVSNNKKLAVVSNGTTSRDFRIAKRNEVGDSLLEDGYELPGQIKAKDAQQAQLKNGNVAALGYIIVNDVQRHMDNGKEFEEALAAAASDLFGERVSVAINSDTPDRICVARQTRPMEALMAKGECYIATSRFGFPEDVDGTVITLPPLRICTIKKDGIHLTAHEIEGEIVDGVCEITPLTHIKAYKLIEEFLSGKKDNPVNLDEIWFELRKHESLFYKKYDYEQSAKVIYDILYQMKLEGKLRMETRPHMTYSGIRNCVMMWLD